METKWLEDFVSLAETRSFSRSAQLRGSLPTPRGRLATWLLRLRREAVYSDRPALIILSVLAVVLIFPSSVPDSIVHPHTAAARSARAGTARMRRRILPMSVRRLVMRRP